MIPESVSASSLETASQCLARYKATSIQKGAGINNPAAMLGTALHGALERFVNPPMIQSGLWDWDFLLTVYTHSFEVIFGINGDKSWYDEGKKILWDWFNRPDMQQELSEATILSQEIKESFYVPYVVTQNGTEIKRTVPLNYIIDRLDQIGDKIYRVVDYKSQRIPLNPLQLKQKIQPKVYALAAQIKFPDAEQIWVQFDFLRYDRVAALFTRSDNAETWRTIKRAVQRIVDTDENNPPETLNENCRYCPKKFSCKTLHSNILVGGAMSLEIDDLAVLYHDIKSQADAFGQIKDEIEHMLLAHAAEQELLEWEIPIGTVEVKSRNRRKVNQDKLEKILGPELAKEYGRATLKDLEELRKDSRLTASQRSLLETAIEYERSDPYIKITRNSSQ